MGDRIGDIGKIEPRLEPKEDTRTDSSIAKAILIGRSSCGRLITSILPVTPVCVTADRQDCMSADFHC